MLTTILALTGCSSGEGHEKPEPETPPVMEAAKLLIEHNATDADTGFQAFADGDPWDELEIAGPEGPIVVARPAGSLHGFGLTEFFFETSEPENADVPIADLLRRLPEGTYTFTGRMVGGTESTMNATFTHTIPAGPVFLEPADGAEDVDPNATVVSWDPVTETVDGSTDIHVVGYQVIVEKVEEPQPHPQGFAQTNFSVYLPASATTVTIPPEFMEADAFYSCEILAIEESGNQTLSNIKFATGDVSEPPENEPEFALTQAKLLIEHNSTDRDTGFQGFADGDPWNELLIDPTSPVVVVNAEGSFTDFGLTELFFETEEPENAEVPIPDVLARLPEGSYTFTGDIVGAAPSSLTATFTHTIPAGPVITSPAASATNVSRTAAVVSWEMVSTTVDGSSDIEIVGYEVIVEKAVEPEFPQTFAQPVLDVHVPPSVTSLSIPEAFLEPGAPYSLEVLAIEASGNQTLTQRSFETR
jgi:hypothetical protein